MAASLQRAAQLPEIVNLSVEDYCYVACFVEYGLMTAGKINNAEAPHPQRHRGSDKQAIFIWATMPKRFHHPACNRFGLLAALNSDDATNSTHNLFGVTKQNFSYLFKLIAQTQADNAKPLSTIPAQDKS